MTPLVSVVLPVYNGQHYVRAAIESVLAQTYKPIETIEGNTVQDYDLWLRIARWFPLAYVPERLTIWRLHPGQGYWSRSQMLTQELGLLDRITKKPTGRLSAAMKARLATLLMELGEA